MAHALVIDDNRNTADALVEMLDMLGVEARPGSFCSPEIG